MDKYERVPYFCTFYDRDCNYEKCPAFYSVRTRTQREIEGLNRADIPVIGNKVKGKFCYKFGEEALNTIYIKEKT